MEYTPIAPQRIDVRRDARETARKTVGDDKVLNIISLANNSVGQAQLKTETASISITGTSTSGTATVTSGNIILGYYLSAFTTPVASYVQSAIASTTLTVTLSTAPGAGNSVTIVVVMLKT